MAAHDFENGRHYYEMEGKPLLMAYRTTLMEYSGEPLPRVGGRVTSDNFGQATIVKSRSCHGSITFQGAKVFKGGGG